MTYPRGAIQTHRPRRIASAHETAQSPYHRGWYSARAQAGLVSTFRHNRYKHHQCSGRHIRRKPQSPSISYTIIRHANPFSDCSLSRERLPVVVAHAHLPAAIGPRRRVIGALLLAFGAHHHSLGIGISWALPQSLPGNREARNVHLELRFSSGKAKRTQAG